MIFSDYKTVANSEARKVLLKLADEGIKSVLPKQFMPKSIKLADDILFVKDKKFPIKGKRIFVIGSGKASASMAIELERILGTKRITYGIVISNDKSSIPKKIKIHLADHPIPSERSVLGSKKILDMKKLFNINENDLVIALLSGGGSSLMSYPVEGVSLDDIKIMNEVLIRSGANVHEMTTIKKKISNVKGGKLAQYFYPVPIIFLILSDVVRNDLTVISSGPFTKDTTSFMDALCIIERYKIRDKIPLSILSHLEKNKKIKIKDEDFSHVYPFILADNDTTLNEIKDKALKKGIDVFVEHNLQGESKNVAYNICSHLQKRNIQLPALFLYGGETTVTLQKLHGKGGRNQEFVLACLNYLQQKPFNNHWCIASIATDGMDYIDESAGGIIDDSSLKLINKKNLDIKYFLERHDSYNLLTKINSNLHVNGATGTNVCDMMMFFLTR